jgi:hypothetical protein
MAKKFKIKLKAGKIVEYPVNKMKKALSDAGFTGKLLVKATSGVIKEVNGLTKGGVITATNLEKAIMKSVMNTNKLAMDMVQRFTKKVLK